MTSELDGMVFVVYQAFNRPDVIKKAIQRFRSSTDLDGIKVNEVIADCHYPVPDKKQNHEELIALAMSTGCGYMDLERNRGQSSGINEINSRLALRPQDTVVFFDPDIKIDKNTWLRSALKVIKNKHADFVTVDCVHILNGTPTNVLSMQGQTNHCESIWYKELIWIGGWPIGIYSGRFVGKYKILEGHNFYGRTEYDVFEALRINSLKGVMLMDYIDLRDTAEQDPEYAEWKRYAIDKPSAKSFDEWLQSR